MVGLEKDRELGLRSTARFLQLLVLLKVSEIFQDFIVIVFVILIRTVLQLVARTVHLLELLYEARGFTLAILGPCDDGFP